MKPLVYISIAFIILMTGFLMWTWRYPYHLGFRGVEAVGYYRAEIVIYDMNDYGHRNSVTVFEKLGTTTDFIKFLINLKAPEDIGITEL